MAYHLPAKQGCLFISHICLWLLLVQATWLCNGETHFSAFSNEAVRAICSRLKNLQERKWRIVLPSVNLRPFTFRCTRLSSPAWTDNHYFTMAHWCKIVCLHRLRLNKHAVKAILVNSHWTKLTRNAFLCTHFLWSINDSSIFLDSSGFLYKIMRRQCSFSQGCCYVKHFCQPYHRRHWPDDERMLLVTAEVVGEVSSTQQFLRCRKDRSSHNDHLHITSWVNRTLHISGFLSWPS